MLDNWFRILLLQPLIDLLLALQCVKCTNNCFDSLLDQNRIDIALFYEQVVHDL